MWGRSSFSGYYWFESAEPVGVLWQSPLFRLFKMPYWQKLLWLRVHLRPLILKATEWEILSLEQRRPWKDVQRWQNNWTVFEGANNLTVWGIEQKTIIKWKDLHNTCISLDRIQPWGVIIVSLEKTISWLKHHTCSTWRSLKGRSEKQLGFNKDWKEDLFRTGEKVREKWQLIWEFKPDRLNTASIFASWNCNDAEDGTFFRLFKNLQSYHWIYRT